MKEVIERCNWLVNKCNDKAITPDVKADFRYLLEEIERLNKELKETEEFYLYQIKTLNEIIKEKDKEIERLNNIIKEVREYIGLSDELRKLCTYYDVNGIDILEILDKVSNNENNKQ